MVMKSTRRPRPVRIKAARRRKAVTVRAPERRKEPVVLQDPGRRDDAQGTGASGPTIDVSPVLARPVSFREAYDCRRSYWEAPDPRRELERMYEGVPANATGDAIAIWDERLERERRNRKLRSGTYVRCTSSS
jgi:hypothetical protein